MILTKNAQNVNELFYEISMLHQNINVNIYIYIYIYISMPIILCYLQETKVKSLLKELCNGLYWTHHFNITIVCLIDLK
jgi:hypothetical protein